MLHLGRGVLDLDVGEGVGRAAVTDQQAVALGVIACVFGPLVGNAHQTAVGLTPLPRRDPLGDDGGTGIAPQVDHLGPGVRLLPPLGHGDGIELADRPVPAQDAARVLPGDRRAGLRLGPGNLERAPRQSPRLVTKL